MADAELALRMVSVLCAMGTLNASQLPSVIERLRAGAGLIDGSSPAGLLQLCNLAALSWMEGAAEAQVACQGALDAAIRRGSASGILTARTTLAVIASAAGDVRRCEEQARAGVAIPGSHLAHMPPLIAILVWALVQRGELDEADALLQPFDLASLPVLTHFNFLVNGRGLLRAAQGRDEEALAEWEEYRLRQEVGCHVGSPSIAWRLPAARAALRLGRTEQARGFVEEHAVRAQRWGTPAAEGVALQGAALLADERTDAIALLEHAVSLLAQGQSRLDHAAGLVDLGAVLRREGRRTEAQRHLTDAQAMAMACGATVLAQQANTELGAAGARPRRLQFSGADSLTASERRVASMAAEGRSNAQIAQALYITPKTVENHLGRVYLKLGIRSRNELTQALAA